MISKMRILVILLAALITAISAVVLGLSVSNISYWQNQYRDKHNFVNVWARRWNQTAEMYLTHTVSIDYKPRAELTLAPTYALLVGGGMGMFCGGLIGIMAWRQKQHWLGGGQRGRLTGLTSFLLYGILILVALIAMGISWGLHAHKRADVHFDDGSVWHGPDNIYVAPHQFFTLERWDCALKVHTMFASKGVIRDAIESQCMQAQTARKMIVPVLALAIVTLAVHIWAWRGLKLSVSHKDPPSPNFTVAPAKTLSLSDDGDLEKDLPSELSSPTGSRSPVGPIGAVTEADAKSVNEMDAGSIKELEGSFTPKELEAGHLPAEKDGMEKR